MTAQLIDGKQIAEIVKAEVAAEVAVLAEQSIVPRLVAVIVGDDAASQVYVRNKERACLKAGIAGDVVRLASSTTQKELLDRIDGLNRDDSVHGILVQLPLPQHLDPLAILDAIHPGKDVDGFHPENVGLMLQGRPRFLPCTPHGVMKLIQTTGVSTAGAHAVVIGRSDIVGKPMAALLVQKGVDATVTICHSRTLSISDMTRQADILIAAVGIPEFVTGDMIRPGAVVIDVGINRRDDRIVGDVHFESAVRVASAITPVPGGVGPMTIAMLLRNTLTAARMLSGYCGNS